MDNHNHSSSDPSRDVDLVCGMEVEKTTPYKTIYQEKTYHFCSSSCQEHFENDPEQYLGTSVN